MIKHHPKITHGNQLMIFLIRLGFCSVESLANKLASLSFNFLFAVLSFTKISDL